MLFVFVLFGLFGLLQNYHLMRSIVIAHQSAICFDCIKCSEDLADGCM